jgi:hypothetical protein
MSNLVEMKNASEVSPSLSLSHTHTLFSLSLFLGKTGYTFFEPVGSYNAYLHAWDAIQRCFLGVGIVYHHKPFLKMRENQNENKTFTAQS